MRLISSAVQFYFNNVVHLDSTVKPVLSDYIKQDMLLAFQVGGCLLLHESSELSTLLSFSNKQPPVCSNFHVS